MPNLEEQLAARVPSGMNDRIADRARAERVTKKEIITRAMNDYLASPIGKEVAKDELDEFDL